MKLSDLRNSAAAKLNPHLFDVPDIGVGKIGKYRNKKVEIDGIVFDSTTEGERYKFLRMLLERGELLYLFTQYEFQLNHKGNFSYRYLCDFVYAYTDGKMICEDSKGALTPVYKKKKKLMKKLYGINIYETK